ncbi:MAG: N-acetylmuramoyl-L-alanine amidase [Lachnospiraceae bacterium]|nr:N-acetylmuramoyl-L-alanine amidase [Lachnospiraceae bacterium]
MKRKLILTLAAGLAALTLASCGSRAQTADTPSDASTAQSVAEITVEAADASVSETSAPLATPTSVPSATPISTDSSVTDSFIGDTPVAEEAAQELPEGTIDQREVYLTEDLEFADYSAIHSDPAILYENHKANSNGITVCVNAGHGTSGGESVRTQCHPDGTPKVTGGSTAEGSTTATAVASGMTFQDGTEERSVTLAAALILRDRLLDAGYSVLMIRETDDVQLDNIARTVLANSYANCHIALHWDSTDYDKGAYYMKVPSVDSYKSMYPVSETWEMSDQFGDCLVQGLAQVGRKVFDDGHLEMDLTQTSYSKVPSIDIELGDRASDHSDETLRNIAEGLLMGVNAYFGIGGQG